MFIDNSLREQPDTETNKANGFKIESITEMSGDCDTRENMRNKEFHLKLTRMEEENSIFREEIEKLDENNLILKRQNTCLKRQLEQIRKKHSELQREHDERKVALDDVIKKEKIVNVSLKQSMKERQVLSTKLEAAELEAQEVATLKEKLTKITNERSESTKQIMDAIEKLDEKHNECESLRRMVKELEKTNERLWKYGESQENMIRVLRQENRELTDDNRELKSLIDINARLSMEKLSTTPNLDGEPYFMYGTFYESDSAFPQDSLYDELKASGFTSVIEEDDTTNRLLKDQMHLYESEICNLLEQTENIFKRLVSICGEKRVPLCVTKSLEYTECSETLQNFEKLGQRIQMLLDMVTTIPFKVADIGREIGTQVRADSGATEDLREFSVFNFSDRLDYPFLQDKTVACCNSSNNKQDPFLSVKLPKMKIVPESSIIDPIVEALDEIVQRTANPHSSPRKQNSMESLSLSKYRSANVLPDILHDDRDFLLQTVHKTAQRSSHLTRRGKDLKRTNENTKRNGHAFTKIENNEERDIFNIIRERTKDCTAVIGDVIDETSSSYESHTYEIEKSDLTSSRDICDEMENSLEENNNNSLKSNSILNVCQNFKHNLVDPSKFDIVAKEDRLRIPVSRTFTSTIITSSWRVFVSCGLIFILGFYTTKFILSMNKYAGSQCQWWSLEEILSGYFSIRNTGPPPL
ncbi:hypothetical protein KPH14_007944 [Odynerus spinipes]|uniref:Uncharacterized protein n=1 Tax=Odynerus spinipes TaxID=1348599 RepID=A0AAD9VND0_9HYME|nr:hypothetical protein KPH14_007944 [Odynerus spinipes]